MSYDDFFAAIRSTRLQAVAQHWASVRGAKTIPGWHNINPSRIAASLKLIWVYKYDRGSGVFTGRLAGDAIEAAFGKSFHNTPMTEIYPPSDYQRLYERAKRVVTEPAFFRGDGMVFKHIERIGEGERIMLPLAEDGCNGDGVLGATVYHSTANMHAPTDRENEYWYSF